MRAGMEMIVVMLHQLLNAKFLTRYCKFMTKRVLNNFYLAGVKRQFLCYSECV